MVICEQLLHFAYSFVFSSVLTFSPRPFISFPIFAFYANSTEVNDAVRVHFIGVLTISLFLISVPCV